MSELLFARIDDILQMAENGIFSYSDFLNESEAAKVRRYISKPAEGIIYSFFGGFEDSERCRFFAYPDYYVFDDNKDCIRAVEIRGSGFAALRHSSFFGRSDLPWYRQSENGRHNYFGQQRHSVC